MYEISKLVIEPKDTELFVGAELLYKVKGYDEHDNQITDEMTLDWSVDGGGTVDEYGLFKAERVGNWIISVFDDDTSTEATAVVHIKAGEDTDSDGDGMPDLWEIEHGLNPQMAGDEKTDPDVDGATNLEEYKADTNPNSGDSFHADAPFC